MTKKQFIYLMCTVVLFSILIGLYSKFNEDAEWLGAFIGLGVAFIIGAFVIATGGIEIVKQLTNKNADVSQKKWLVKRLVIIAIFALMIFTVSYFRTPH